MAGNDVQNGEVATQSIPNIEKLNTNETNNDEEDLVTPWEVKTTSNKGIDYDKLIGMSSLLYLNPH